MRIRSTLNFTFAFLVLVVGAVAQEQPKNTLTSTQQNLIDEKRAWVKEVEAGDYFFWERFFRRLENKREFPMPTEWYVPSALVEGGINMPLPVAIPTQRTIPASAFKQIEDYAFARQTGALLVMRNGVIEYEKYAEGEHAGSLLPVRSFTKGLPSLLIGISIGEGKISSLDDPIGNYIDEWKSDPRGKITIRQLLHMASGLESVPLAYVPGNKNLLLSEGSDVNKVTLTFARVGEPDTVWALNQVDSQLLGMIVERATGVTFTQYLSARLWRRIGAQTATLNLDGKAGAARTFCCMRAIAADWLRVGQLIANKGRWGDQQVIPRSYVEEMVKPSPANPYMGLHLWLGWKEGAAQQQSAAGTPLIIPHANPYAADDVVYFSGGSSILTWIVPSQKLVIVRWGYDVEDWDTSRIPNVIIRSLTGARK